MAVAFFDVDGTLVWHDEERALREGHDVLRDAPTQAVYDAFRRMRAAGHLTFICTGRPVSFLPEPIRALRPDGYVAGAGAYVEVGGRVVCDSSVPPALLAEVAERFFAAGLGFTLESNERSVDVRPSGGPSPFPGVDVVHEPDELAPLLRDRPFSKFCAHRTTLEALAPVLPFCREHFTVADMQHGTFEFALRGTDKGSGVRAALSALGRGRAGTFAFGDSENDLPMASAVETFVAMGNALPVVRERADYVAPPVERGGVPAALRHFGLI